jgi:tRNA threonylcarbamoyladenosine modification (KEOPS) complex Cgi121 subunit
MNESVPAADIANNLSEGVVGCAYAYVAGIRHITGILDQALEYWARRIYIARNRSIDLLMRITCQPQISNALLASKASSKAIAVFGASTDEINEQEAVTVMEKAGGKRDDSLLQLTSDKVKFLRRFHNIPAHVPRDQIADLLAEKSVLLVFSK